MHEQKLIPAATILLVRDAPALEVLMVERHHQIDFASGALVFPGGKTHSDDSLEEWEELIDGGEPPAHRALMIAAIREAFEESGVLLARRKDQRGVGAPLAGADDTADAHPFRNAIAKHELAGYR